MAATQQREIAEIMVLIWRTALFPVHRDRETGPVEVM